MEGHGPIRSAIINRKVTLFMVVLMALFGIYNYFITPRQEAPEISPPVAIITAVYPGASPEDVEKLVTRKIEDKITEIEGYDVCTSNSRHSFSLVVLELDNDTDTDKAWDVLRQKMDDLQNDLPQGCQKIKINTDLMDTAGMIISLSGKNYSYEELAAYAESLERKLSKINGVSRFEVTGKQEKEVRIRVDAAKLNQYHLSLEDISKVIQAHNVEIPSGNLDNGHTKINVTASGVYESLTEIENTIVAVSPQTGATVRLKDLAEIDWGLEDSNFKIKHNGENAVLLTGYFKKNINVVTVGKKVETRINEFKQVLPRDIHFDEVVFQPWDVRESVNNFIINLLEGIAFVIVVVFIGMGFRNALVVSTAIPLSIIVTFSMMRLLGINIHQVSIAALIIALGMLVDNAIVVSDAIQVRLDRDEEKLTACVSGTAEVAIPVLSSTLTTVGAFLPLLMLNSIAGDYIISIPQIVMISLSVSYLIALFVTPTMAYLFFKKSQTVEKEYKIRRIFSRLLNGALNHKKQAILVIAAMVLVTYGCFRGLGLEFFPKSDKNVVYIDIRVEQNTDISKTEQVADAVETIIKQQPEVVKYTTAIGDGIPKFFDSMPLYTQAQDFAQILVRLDLKKGKRFKKNSEFADCLQEIFDRKISGGTVTVKQLEQGEPIGAPVRLRITSNQLERLGETAELVKQELSKIDGTINIDDNFSDKDYQFLVDIDNNLSSQYGISKYDIQKEVSIALRGQAASIYRKDGNEYDILVKSNIENKEALENLAVKSSVTGQKILLKQVANIKLWAKIASINKYDREMSVTVYSDVKPGYSSVKIQKELKSRLNELELNGVEWVFDGEEEQIKENFGDLGFLAIFAVLVVYMILLIQFNSYTQPLVILITIPLSVIGSILGLFIFRQPFSFTALLGIVSLLGVVVNNAIILIDFINTERREGKKITDACRDAVNKRFRPIMLTTTTTIIGLLPLIFSGSELFRPLSISLMSGLMVSTLLTLVVIPMVYTIAENKKIQIQEHLNNINLNN